MEKEKKHRENKIWLSISVIVSSIIIGQSLIIASTNISTRLDQISGSISAVSMTMNNNYIYESKKSNILSFSEAAKYIGIEGTRLRILIDSDAGIPYARFGENYYFSKSGIDEWFSSRTINFEY